MKTIHDDKSRQDLFNKPPNSNIVNDNHLPSTSADYEKSEAIIYEMSDGQIEALPHFCLTRISKPKNNKGQIHVFYNSGKITIKGRNLENLLKKIAFKKIAIIRITHPDDDSPTSENSFSIDEITFEEN